MIADLRFMCNRLPEKKYSPRNQAERRLASFASIVTHDTLLAWHRRRLARNASKKRKTVFASRAKT